MATKTSGGNAAFHNFHNDFAHIQDPNERRRLALAEIDKAPFGWYHVRAIIVAGIGFFTDAYDIFAIGLVTNMLGVVYVSAKGDLSRSCPNKSPRMPHRFTNFRSGKTTNRVRVTFHRRLIPPSRLQHRLVRWSVRLASDGSPIWLAESACTVSN